MICIIKRCNYHAWYIMENMQFNEKFDFIFIDVNELYKLIMINNINKLWKIPAFGTI